MKIWNTFANNANTQTDSDGYGAAATGTRRVEWLDMAYVGFIVVAVTGAIACLFI